MEMEIDLEKKIKELDNIICKVGQSAQTVHMLTKPQAFYDNTHKQALGYQNPFYLKKAQRIKPTLYDGVVMSNTHVDMPVIDDEETLILEEESRSKMSEKVKDLEVIAKKISHKPIDYEKLNILTDDFGKMEVPKELPKVSLVNASLKKLKFHLTQFDTVVKKRTTPNALEEARLQDKDTIICKLKDTIKSLRKNTKEEIMNHDKYELEPINEELENSVAKLLSENECLCNEINHVKQDTCPNAITSSTRKVVVTPMNNVKKVRFVEPFTSSSNIKQVKSSNTSDSNTLVLSSIGVKCSTSNCGSKPPGNKKNDMILQSPSRNKKNKVKAQPRKVNKMNHVVKPVCDVDVKHSLSNANSEILCVTCNKFMFDGVHDKCLLDLMQNRNNRTKSAKKHKKYLETYRFTSTNVVPPKQTTSHSDEIQKPEIKVYCRKPKNVNNIGSSKMAKIVESKNANHSEHNHTWGSNATDIPLSSSLVMTGTTRLQGLWGMVTISWEMLLSQGYTM
ncbi:hypothetical protein Tco_0659014 [Tanacetum coccineum]